MTRWLKRAVLVVGVCLAASHASYAQLKEDFELSIFGGGSGYTKKDFVISYPQSLTPIPGSFKFNYAMRAGVRVNVYTRGHWGQEFFYSYEPNTARFRQRTAPPRELDLDLQIHNYGANALYYLVENEDNRVRPFLTAGVGGTLYRFPLSSLQIARNPSQGNVPDINSDNELAFNYGGGFKAKLGNWAGFRMDGRGFMGRQPSFGLARSSINPGATVFPASGMIMNAEASIGLIFYFGR